MPAAQRGQIKPERSEDLVMGVAGSQRLTLVSHGGLQNQGTT